MARKFGDYAEFKAFYERASSKLTAAQWRIATQSEWPPTSDQEVLSEAAIPYPIVFQEKGMKHWHGMCEFLRQHQWGMGLERFLKLGYIPEHEQAIMDKARWGGSFEHADTANSNSYRIYRALRDGDVRDLRRLYDAAKGQSWNQSLRDKLIDDVEDPKGRFNCQEIHGYRTTDTIGLARSIFKEPDAGISHMLFDALIEAGCENEKLLIWIRDGNVTRGSVIIHSLVWENPKDGINDSGDMQLWLQGH